MGLVAQRRIQLTGNIFKRLGITPRCINLQQFHAYFMAIGIFEDGFLENFLGLSVPAIGHVHLGLGNRIDIMRIDCPQTGLAEIGQE